MNRLLAVAAVLLLGSGCVILRPRRAVQISEREALSIGRYECQLRGYACHLKEIHKTGNEVWKVKFAATRGHQRGHLHLDLDAWSGNVIKVNDKMHGKSGDDRGGGKHHGGDDDDDDHRGRGKGKGKGKGKDD